MQKSCENSNGTMAAILGLDDKIIKETCESFDGNVTAANFNCPGQVVISGELNAVKTICEKFNDIGNTLVSKYYFINKQPSYQLGIVNDKLGAKVSFEPGFESNFSGMFGMNRLDNNWILTGELNLQMENYFKSAERGEFFWRRIDSLSQTIKIGAILPHPFGWRTGVDINYQHEIFRALYASIENRLSLIHI